MMRYLSCFIAIVCFSLHAAIHHVDSVYEIYQHLPHTPFVVFCDIDNTILQPTTWYGSHQWFVQHMNAAMERGCTRQEALDLVLPELIRFHHEEMQPQLVEDHIRECIQYIHNTCHMPVYAITARGDALRDITHTQLSQLGISVSSGIPDMRDDATGIACDKGVIFIAQANKGRALQILFECGWCRDDCTVVCIDDAYHNVEDMVRTCHEHTIDVVGIRYGYCDDQYYV